MRDDEAGLSTDSARDMREDTNGGRKPTVDELLTRPDAFLSRSHLRELGLERRAIDSVFRSLPVIAFPGYGRAMVRASDFLELIEASTYRGDRVRAARRAS
jgi:hypothetical protein